MHQQEIVSKDTVCRWPYPHVINNKTRPSKTVQIQSTCSAVTDKRRQTLKKYYKTIQPIPAKNFRDSSSIKFAYFRFLTLLTLLIDKAVFFKKHKRMEVNIHLSFLILPVD